MKIKASNIYNS